MHWNLPLAKIGCSKLVLIDAFTRLCLPVLRMCPYHHLKSNTDALCAVKGKRCTFKSFFLRVCVCVCKLDRYRHMVGLSKNLLCLSTLKFIGFYLPFYFCQYIFCDTVQSLLWECCSHRFHWGNWITLWPEGECTACTFNGCHNGLEWKIAVFLWPKVHPLCIQGHGILGSWVLAMEFCERVISSFICHFFHYPPSVSLFLCFPPIVFLDSLIWSELLSSCAYVCVCVSVNICLSSYYVFNPHNLWLFVSAYVCECMDCYVCVCVSVLNHIRVCLCLRT